jgi:hypothetical protein
MWASIYFGVASVLTLGVRRIGESRKPADMLLK